MNKKEQAMLNQNRQKNFSLPYLCAKLMRKNVGVKKKVSNQRRIVLFSVDVFILSTFMVAQYVSEVPAKKKNVLSLRIKN
jgi:hypothetical protein